MQAHAQLFYMFLKFRPQNNSWISFSEAKYSGSHLNNAFFLMEQQSNISGACYSQAYEIYCHSGAHRE